MEIVGYFIFFSEVEHIFLYPKMIGTPLLISSEAANNVTYRGIFKALPCTTFHAPLCLLGLHIWTALSSIHTTGF